MTPDQRDELLARLVAERYGPPVWWTPTPDCAAHAGAGVLL